MADAVLALVAVTAACGSDAQGPTPPSSVATGGSASAVVSPAPTATAEPAPTPVAQPSANPFPDGVNDNDAPVDHVGAGVYYVDCNDEILPNSKGAREAGVGCRVHLDATPKDAENVPTNPRYPPAWSYSAPGLIEVAVRNPLGPIITARTPHDQTIFVEVDGVRSNSFKIAFR
jgi:hypothetical protein